MRYVSWNVNGLRAALAKGCRDFLVKSRADAILLQEVRAQPDQVELDLPGYLAFWNPAERKGYAGTMVLSRARPEQVWCGIGVAPHDREGRVITLEFADHFLVDVYTPNAQRGLTRLKYRVQGWDPAFRNHLKRLLKRKPVVFGGDLNVAHQEIDLANPRSNRRNAGFTDEERAGFGKLLQAGFVDTFRELNAEGGHYTWWAQFANARARNIGWRVDYFLISRSLRPRLQAAEILPRVMGSDHCPVALDLA
jgi:exodeoxyribonuclease-3